MSEMDIPAPRRIARKLMVDLSIMTVIGIALAVIGPFGTFEQPLAYRFVAWLSFSYLGYAIYSPMGYVVDKLKAALDLPAAGLWVAAVLVATIPMTVAVWSIGYLPGEVAKPTLEQGLTSYAYVLVIGGGVTALFYALESRKKSHQAIEGAPVDDPDSKSGESFAEQPSIRFLDRLPPSLGTKLIALEMEDHYVRAHTDLGSDLILLRMRDAVAELDDLEGAQIHRSWWVARSAVEEIRREGRNIRLQLTGGLEAPVSRTNTAMLKQAGWF